MAGKNYKRVIKGDDLPEIIENFEKLKTELPEILANHAKNHFLKGFRNQGGATDHSLGGWKSLSKSYQEYKYRNNKKRNILTLTGDLKNDIKRRKATFARTILGTENIPYAVKHNEGKGGMPKREFIGDSKKLYKSLEKEIKTELDLVFNVK